MGDSARAAILSAAFVCVAIIASLLVVVISDSRKKDDLSRIGPAVIPPAVPAEPSLESPEAGDVRDSETEGAAAASQATVPETAPEKVPDKVPQKRAVPVPRREVESKRIPAASPARPKAPVERDPKPAPKRRGELVFVIDDAGNNLRQLEPFLALPGQVSVAVLPGLPHSAEAARMVRAAGKELLLHQPMESVGGQNPGPGAIGVGMSAAEIRSVLERNLAEIGPVAGMNNHQGSLVTADADAMESVLAFCRDKGIFFLDSRTTADTVSGAVAAKNGIRIRERDVFVDNIQDRAAMIRFVEEGLQKAEKKGAAVMIGHAWSAELASTLRELYPELIEQGFSLSTIAKIMMGTVDDEDFGD